MGGRRKYQIHLKTEAGQIAVVLLEDGERDSIVVQVPPASLKEEGGKEEVQGRLGLVSRLGEGVKREREEEEEGEVRMKRRRLEEQEEEEDTSYSDAEVEQTLEGAVASLGNLPGHTWAQHTHGATTSTSSSDLMANNTTYGYDYIYSQNLRFHQASK